MDLMIVCRLERLIFFTVQERWDRAPEIKCSEGSVYQDAAKAHKLKMIFGADIQEPTLQSRLIHTRNSAIWKRVYN